MDINEKALEVARQGVYYERSLRPGGYLLLGHSETLSGNHDGFETKRFPGTIIYKKREK